MTNDVTIAEAGAAHPPLLPASLKPLLTAPVTIRISDDGGYDEVERRWVVPSVDQGALDACRAHLAVMEAWLEPAPPRRIAARVAALLAHYYLPDATAELQRAVAHDWIDGLAEYPWPLVAEACRRWLAMERRRPTVADIRGLCQTIGREPLQIRDRLRRIVAGSRDGASGEGKGAQGRVDPQVVALREGALREEAELGSGRRNRAVSGDRR